MLTDQASKKLRVADSDPETTKLWKLSNDFCLKWQGNTDALGARNVLAAFYLLARCAQNSLGAFPDNEKWFDFAGRFLALYVRDQNSDTGEEVQLTPFVKSLVETAIKDVTVRTLKTEAGPEKWAEMINADCKTGTQGKIDELVTASDLGDPKMELVVMAAEFIKGDWVTPFRGTTITGTPFYGTGEGAPVGKCNMMNHSDESKAYLWEGQYCDVALMPTGAQDDYETENDIYGLVVLPKGEQGKPTDPAMMDAAAKEVAENLEGIKGAIRWVNLVGVKRRGYDSVRVQMPRIKHKMAPVNLTQACGEVLPGPLLSAINGVTMVNNKDLGWVNSPLEVNKVVHATYLQVNETGFEAAAATAIIVYRSIGVSDEEDDPYKLLRCDRGFLFYLADLGSHPHVLYYSRVTDAKGLEEAPQAPNPENALSERAWDDLPDYQKRFETEGK